LYAVEYRSYENRPATANHAGTGINPYNWNVILGAIHASRETIEYMAPTYIRGRDITS